MTGKKWTKEETEFMIKHRLDYSLAEMSARVGHPKSSVLCKIYNLGYTWRRKKIENRKFWTPNEDRFLKDNYGEISTRKIAEKLDRTLCSVRNRIEVLNLWHHNQIQISEAPGFCLDEPEAAYLAAIVDGEGSLSISVSWRRKYPRIIPTLGISNTNLELIKWIQEKLSIRAKYVKRARIPGSKTVYATKICHRIHLKNVISRIFPYLIVKRKFAIEILKILKLKEKNAFNDDLLRAALKFKELVNNQNPRVKKSVERLRRFIETGEN